MASSGKITPVSNTSVPVLASPNNPDVISLGLEEIEKCLPSGGVRSGQLMMLIGGNGSGKTMLASQVVSSIVAQDRNCLFFELETSMATLWSRLETQALAKGIGEEATVREQLQRRLLIIDNVPSGAPKEMTPKRVESSIREAELEHFGDPVEVVVIDSLTLMGLGTNGQLMQNLFQICKRNHVLMIVLNTTPKTVPAGTPFKLDGLGSYQQTDFCDYVLQIWRPEQEAGLSLTDQNTVKDQCQIVLGKNRHGPSGSATRYLATRTMVFQPDNPADILSDERAKLIASGFNKTTF